MKCITFYNTALWAISKVIVNHKVQQFVFRWDCKIILNLFFMYIYMLDYATYATWCPNISQKLSDLNLWCAVSNIVYKQTCSRWEFTSSHKYTFSVPSYSHRSSCTQHIRIIVYFPAVLAVFKPTRIDKREKFFLTLTKNQLPSTYETHNHTHTHPRISTLWSYSRIRSITTWDPRMYIVWDVCILHTK